MEFEHLYILGCVLFLQTVSINSQFGVKVFDQNEYEVVFERCILDHYNRDLMEKFEIITFKYNRSMTVINGSGILNVDVTSIAISIVGYKYSVNEYKKTALQFHMDGCQILSIEAFGIGLFKKYGNLTNCPMQKGTYTIYNIYLSSKSFPPHLPEGRWRVEVQVALNKVHAYMLDIYFSVVYGLKGRKNTFG